MNEEKNYDLIIVGSGIGALTTASLMARMKKWKVLVLERHYVIGGFTQVFRRPGKYKWDVGLHYVGEMAEGSEARTIFDFVTGGGVYWNKMPEPFEKFVYPDFAFDLYGEEERFQGDLIERFPQERKAIESYFKDLKKCARRVRLLAMAEVLPPFLRSPMRRLALSPRSPAGWTTGAYLERNFRDPQLKALLVSQWGRYGLPPSKSAFLIHGNIASHYMHGGYYPEGGAAKIAQAVVPIIEACGGRALVNHEVTKILVENGRAIGVETKKKMGGQETTERFFAPAVVSDAGAYNTYTKLLPQEIGAPYAETMRGLLPGTTSVGLYLGLRKSPTVLGFKGENHWIYEGYDHEAHFQGNGLLAGKPTFCYLAFSSLKDPTATAHTAEIVAFADYGKFREWAGQPWMKRGEAYEALKETIAEGLLSLVEKHHPGFKDLVDYKELSTPLTIEHFTASPEGAIYGMAVTPERFRQHWIGVRTPVEKLYLIGADALSFGGIVGAMMGGVVTAGMLHGPFGYFRVMAAIRKQRRRLPN
ncbi:phytoene desaturase family protein [Nitrospinota bacterium]